MTPLQSSSSTTTATQLSKDDVHFEIRQYRPEDRNQVLKLVAEGLLQNEPEGHPRHEFWVQYVSDGLPDVEDIPGHYLSAGSNFFVVTATTTSCEESAAPIIIATTGIERKSDSTAEVRRVSVKDEFRRFGVGRMLMHHVHKWAKNELKYEKIVVCNCATHLHAVKFYDSLGYQFVKNSRWTVNLDVEVNHVEKYL